MNMSEVRDSVQRESDLVTLESMDAAELQNKIERVRKRIGELTAEARYLATT